MTKEEAKEILTHNWTRVDNPNYSESELDEAFFMAIEALQQVTGKLNNRDDSLLTADEEAVKERKSKLDLISRSRAIKEVSEWATDILHPKNLIKEDAIGILESLPSAEQKQGKWSKEIKGNGWNEWAVLTCDQCGAVIKNPTFETNFCPNCGARMKGGAE